MANQKITDLNKMQKLSKSDLLIVVDTDASGLSGSPTGETMAIEANTLASQLAEIQQGDVGISLPSLSDVPNDYSGWGGGYLQINESEDGVSFTDSPGASELSIPIANQDGILNFYVPAGSSPEAEYLVGNVLTRNGTKYRKASSVYKSDELNAVVDDTLMEVVGVIRKIKREDPSDANSKIEYINIAFGGHVQFEGPDGLPVKPCTSEIVNEDGVPQPTALADGATYFLSSDNLNGNVGMLSRSDPSQSFSDALSHVSKPVLVATSESSGVLVNYRGLICESGEEPHKFVIEVDASCSNIKVGDVVRLKRKISRNQDGSFGIDPTGPFEEVREGAKPAYLDVVIDGDHMMSNARAASGAVNEKDKAYYTDVLGIVIVSTSDYFQVQTAGMINFEKPEGILNTGNKQNRTNAIFKQGYTYYLDAFEPETVQSDFSRARLSQSIYDYTEQEYEDAFQTGIETATWADTDMMEVTTGIRPFRNTTIHNPFRRDDNTGAVTVYEKAVFYAVSDTQILLLNSPAYPSPVDQCNATNPNPASTSFCGSGGKTTHLTTTEAPYTSSTANAFLNNALPNSQENDHVFITHTGWQGTDTFQAIEGTYVTENWYLPADSNTATATGVWNLLTRTTT
jgi:hypothetical protein